MIEKKKNSPEVVEDELEEGEIRLKNKHVKLRVVLFIVFFVLGLTGIGLGVYFSVQVNPGWFALTASDDSDFPYYKSDITTNIYFDESYGNIKSAVNEANEFYTDVMKKAYALIDDTSSHTGYSCIADINKNINSDVTISSELYSLLEDALNKTNENHNFSIYMSPIFAEWNWLFSLPEEIQLINDPSVNPIIQEEINEIIKYCSPDYINLELKGSNIVRLNITQDYLDFFNNYEFNISYLSLNSLKNAYRLQYIINAFNENGKYLNGYISTTDGLLISLKNNAKPVYSLYDLKNEVRYNYGEVSTPSLSSGVVGRRFPLYVSSSDSSYYKIGSIYRNPFINITTGIPDEIYTSCNLFSYDNNILRNAYLMTYYSTLSETNLKNELTSLIGKVDYIYTLNETDKNVYSTNNLNNYLTMHTELEYNLIKF